MREEKGIEDKRNDSSTGPVFLLAALRRGRDLIWDGSLYRRKHCSALLTGRIVLLSLITVISFTSSAKSQEETNAITAHAAKVVQDSSAKFSGGWKLTFGGRNFAEAEDEATKLLMGVKVNGRYQLVKQLYLSADIGLKLISGREQSRFAPAGEDDSQISFDEFYLNFAVTDNFDFRVGALSQKYIGVPSLVDSRMSFPGLREQIRWNRGAWETAITFQQVIPTSKSLDIDRNVKEETPRFFTETISSKYTSPRWYTFSGSLTHYEFDELPGVVAVKGGRLGNTIIGDFSTDSEFFYSFVGVAAAVEFCLCGFEKIDYNLRYTAIENNNADSGFGKGESLKASITVDLPGLVLAPSYAVFYNESDTSPAYYNNSKRGHNNRVGTEIGIELLFTDMNFGLIAKYTEAETINDDPHQDTLTTTYVGLETLNVVF